MAKKKELHTYILLDRSGSMAGGKWTEAISSINYFIQKQKEQKDFKSFITLAVFDGTNAPVFTHPNLGGVRHFNEFKNESLSFDVLRESVDAETCIPLVYAETSPRGATPLFDATAKLLDLASKRSAKYTSIVIMTDGEENASKTWTKEAIKERLKNLTEKNNWQVTFLGADFDVTSQAMSVGIGIDSTASVSRGRMMDAVALYSSKTSDFVGKNTRISYSVEERAELNKPKES